MAKQLIFTNDHVDTFWALYFALQRGRHLQQVAPGIETMRKERRAERALRAISEPDPLKSADLLCPKCGSLVMPRDPQDRRLLLGGGVVVLESEDIEMLKERIDKGPWLGVDVSVKMVDAYTFLCDAKEFKDIPGAD